MPRHARSLFLCTLLAAGGCRLGQAEPVALHGPAPRSVVVWPRLPEAFADVEQSLLAGLDIALRRRGYDVHSVAVGRQLLLEADLLTLEPELARVSALLAVDAVLQLDVGEFTASSDGLLQRARWDLGWRLLSTRGEGELWHYSHHGTWQRRELDTGDPLRRFDEEPDIVPIGGRGAPNFRDVVDLAAWLHRFALERLPRSDR
ncbi:MAG: hypothetical protein ABIP94_16305 [Planctomycetota bacterium]